MEIKSNKLLSGGLASNGQCTRYRWGHIHHIPLQEEYRLSAAYKLQFAWPSFGCDSSQME